MCLRSELEVFFMNYGEDETVQNNESAFFDSQIKNVSLTIAETISQNPAGTILDIGCGNGILLRRIASISFFKQNSKWLYVGSDFIENKKTVLNLAVDLEVHRRTEFIELKSLYSSRDYEKKEMDRPFLVFIRNVFHELSIDETANLLFLLHSLLNKKDTLIIQDLQVFPKAERGNVCWQYTFFLELLKDCGFNCTSVEEPTAKGNRWFTIKAFSNIEVTGNLTFELIRSHVIKRRTEQYVFWKKSGSLAPDDLELRKKEIALADFDLQLAALQMQLSEQHIDGISSLTNSEESAVVMAAFRKALLSYNPDCLPLLIDIVPQPSHFRDRANSQDSLEEFLVSDKRITVILGGPQMGKSHLVLEVLHKRAHDRQPVFIDIHHTTNVWNIIESYLIGVKCIMSTEILKGIKRSSFNDIKEIITTFINITAKHTIIVWDHFERALDPNQFIQDKEIIEFIKILTSASSSKTIITTTKKPNLNFLTDQSCFDFSQPPVGRFPEGPHVENILDDYIDRSAINLKQYPEELINAIDRMPFLADLAARIIKKEGISLINDDKFLYKVKNKLQRELLQYFINNDSIKAITACSNLRIPVPKEMIIALSSEDSFYAAEGFGILYPVFDPSGNELYTCVGALKTYQNSDDELLNNEFSNSDAIEEYNKINKEIAELYQSLYRKDYDPRWLREIYFHTLASGSTDLLSMFGVSYKSELFWAGDYWYRIHKNYKSALQAFQLAIDFGFWNTTIELRMASCLMRLGNSEGETRYLDLIIQYPNHTGAKTSYIDSLLFLHRYEDALKKLVEFNFTPTTSDWIATQFGRAQLGLHDYSEAIKTFGHCVKSNSTPFTYHMLAKAYSNISDLGNAIRVLRDGLRVHQSQRLNLALAKLLVLNGDGVDKDEAKVILKKLLVRDSRSGSVLHQLCKIYCMEHTPEKAIELLEKLKWNVIPNSYLLPIKVEIFISQYKWSDATELLRNISNNDANLVGLKMKTHLNWARSEENVQRKMEIANEVLTIPLTNELLKNIKILILSARISLISNHIESFQKYKTLINQINPAISKEIEVDESENIFLEADPYSEI